MENFDRLYCIQTCTVGKAKSKELLERWDSALSAALEMDNFVKECKKTCERCKCQK